MIQHLDDQMKIHLAFFSTLIINAVGKPHQSFVPCTQLLQCIQVALACDWISSKFLACSPSVQIMEESSQSSDSYHSLQLLCGGQTDSHLIRF